jgi:hypothetical protein
MAANLQVKNWIQDLQNTKQECYPLNHDVQYDFLLCSWLLNLKTNLQLMRKFFGCE